MPLEVLQSRRQARPPWTTALPRSRRRPAAPLPLVRLTTPLTNDANAGSRQYLEAAFGAHLHLAAGMPGAQPVSRGSPRPTPQARPSTTEREAPGPSRASGGPPYEEQHSPGAGQHPAPGAGAAGIRAGLRAAAAGPPSSPRAWHGTARWMTARLGGTGGGARGGAGMGPRPRAGCGDPGQQGRGTRGGVQRGAPCRAGAGAGGSSGRVGGEGGGRGSPLDTGRYDSR